MTAFVIGNGTSRRNIDLLLLKQKGIIYGCNLLYKEITPDVLVAVDSAISKHIQLSDYSLSHRFYTREPYSDKGALKLEEPYSRWASGPNALQLAIRDGHELIYLIGFDFGGNGQHFNNMYADRKFYKSTNDRAEYNLNWIHQVDTLVRMNRLVKFVLVVGPETSININLKKYQNFKTITVNEFINNI